MQDFFDKKRACFYALFMFSFLHLSVDKECQYDANDTGDGEADCQAELQGQNPQIQHKRGGQTKAAAIIQPAEERNAAQCAADKTAQYDPCQHQQKQYPYVL